MNKKKKSYSSDRQSKEKLKYKIWLELASHCLGQVFTFSYDFVSAFLHW